MKSIDDLALHLRRIDKRPYPAYRDVRGVYAFEGGSVHIDYVQRDPFAPPSRVRVRMRGETVAFDPCTTGNRSLGVFFPKRKRQHEPGSQYRGRRYR